MSKPKVALSFNMDDEEEEVFVVKKSSGDGNKKFKKMRQAPTAASIVEAQKAAPAYPSFGSSYSSETLEQLRNNQKFVVKTSETTAIEGMELSGEAAEQFVTITETLNGDNIATDTVPDDFDGSADFIAFHKGQKESKMLLKGKLDNRLYTQLKDKKEHFDLSEENDEDWEAEIMRRGVINSNMVGGNSKLSSARVANNMDKNASNSLAAESDSVTVEDTVKLVTLAMDKLKHSSETRQSRINQLTFEADKNKEVVARHREKLDKAVQKLNVIQDVRVFLSTLVGMLRVKTDLVQELRQASLAAVRAQSEWVRRSRVEEQEDLVYRVKEANELMAIGEYTPSAIMNTVATAAISPEDRILHTSGLGRREQARVAVRREAVKAFADQQAQQGVAVSLHDQQLFALDRLDEVSDASTRQLLTDLDSRLLGASSYSGNNYAEKLAVLAAAHEAVMEDVDPEVFAAEEVVRQLTLFRSSFPQRYKAGFISLSLPEIFTPLVLYDIVAFTGSVFASAAESNTRNGADSGVSDKMDTGDSAEDQGDSGSDGSLVLCERSWHEPLCEFSSSAEGSEGGVGVGVQEQLVEEGDSQLLPKVVVAAVLPWLTEVVAASLDPLSTAACKSCVDLMSQVLDYDPSVEQLAPLLEAVVAVFTEQLSTLCLPVTKHITPSATENIGDANNTSVLSQQTVCSVGVGKSFAIRQVRRVALLVQNVALFRDFLSPAVTMRLAWRALSVCFPTIKKLLSASDFKHSEMVLALCSSCCALIQTSGGAAGNQFTSSRDAQLVSAGISLGGFRDIQTALNKIAYLRATLSDNDIRLQLKQAMENL